MRRLLEVVTTTWFACLVGLLVVGTQLLGCPPAPVNPGPDADAQVTVVDAGPIFPVPADAAPLPAPLPVADATSPPDIASQACANLRAQNCDEGFKSSCEPVLRHTLDSGVFTINVGCLVLASSPASVRACGGVRCTMHDAGAAVHQ